MSVSIIGTSHSKFGRLEDKTIYDLILEAGRGALADSGLTGEDIDAVFFANYGSMDFNNQSHLGPFMVEIDPGLRFKPCVRVEGACASGSVAVYEAIKGIESGRYKNVLVVGAEKMTSLNGKGVTATLAKASYMPLEGEHGYTFPGLYAELGKGYMAHFGISEEELADTLARISVKAHTNAMQNPLAQMQNGSNMEYALHVSDKNPMVAYPLKLSDCSLVSDGGAAVVLTTTERAKELKDKVVEISAISMMCDHISIVEGKRHNWEHEAIRRAFNKCLDETGLTLADINLAEVHDCFTINELVIYEALGLTEPGKGREAVLDGSVFLGGRLPVNTSGGLKAKGHPVGATGVSMHVLAAKQLMGEAIGAQVEGAQNAVTVNVGGSGGTNVISILRRVK
ncbi:3-ketoacyl-CoA thiolase [Clostridium homopropionicum DSM 5847]|uniref:3-ketoacyl-CoA thiolase n=1 Tax=Clostridium homopropionicum DSM 5847 TaxID=1121318 RepID=A0A0L6ZBT1_9CLOT|nr:thiolase domain-containing protein [Clostridium homopropionicum]KOA20444.1 3-ketoacyl-CoA thiolase [Clostridium homopropionicum DSM 5847]SFG35116.1 acetyl-CoA C-acetyltransferase [Clostridium homopropionicum]